MIIERYEVGSLGTNCYFAGDKDELFVIDPGAGSKKLYEKITEKGYKVKYILLTHCHFDHIGGASELKELTKAKIGVFEGEKENYKNPFVNLSGMFGGPVLKDEPDFVFSEGDVLKSGDFSFSVIHTPGHTNGSVCFLSGNTLFSGDTLFYLSYGRYDFPTGNFQDLKNSINKKLFTLPDSVVCHPGHGDKTTIGFEKKYNEIRDKDASL